MIFIHLFHISGSGMDLLIYQSFSDKSTIYLRIVFFATFMQLVFVLYVFNYTASSFSSATNNSRKYLYSFLCRNKTSIKTRLKISSFIEKLSGPVIGFYCFKIFAFTNYEFYRYLAFVSINFFLIYGLIKY